MCCLFSNLSIGCERRSKRNGSVTVAVAFLCCLIVSLNGTSLLFGGLPVLYLPFIVACFLDWLLRVEELNIMFGCRLALVCYSDRGVAAECRFFARTSLCLPLLWPRFDGVDWFLPLDWWRLLLHAEWLLVLSSCGALGCWVRTGWYSLSFGGVS